MRLTFWGVRGSIATSGPEFARFGGNTTCVEITSEGSTLILDAGTGLRALGQKLLAEAKGRPIDATLLFSHLHWDHIQGFPFFAPAYLPSTTLSSYGPVDEGGSSTLLDVLSKQMQPPSFPVTLGAMPSRKTFATVRSGDELALGPFDVRMRALCHPQGSLGFRIESKGKSLCFATDTEHAAAGDIDDSILELARGVDLLILDAQYTDAEYAMRKGWGHSTYAAAARIAGAAGAKRLALFHHDPGHDDAFVERMEHDARTMFGGAFAAREGLTIDV
jgi:phosphoribosyl 1,2-cyclic phosphodiesterase